MEEAKGAEKKTPEAEAPGAPGFASRRGEPSVPDPANLAAPAPETPSETPPETSPETPPETPEEKAARLAAKRAEKAEKKAAKKKAAKPAAPEAAPGVAPEAAPGVATGAAPGPETAPPPHRFRPPARRAGRRVRHIVLALFFLAWVLAPLGVSAWYLYTVAQDQYASHVGFSVRREEMGSAVEILGGITELSGSSSTDTDILYEFLRSQQIVRLINARLPLAEIFTRPEDPVFSLGEDTRIEALHGHWKRMVKVYYDNASGLIEVRVLAFSPEEAQALAEALFVESAEMINRLSAIARADATRYAQEELERAVERLKAARQAMTAFQNRTGIVDPAADLQGQMGVLNGLNGQLANAQVDLELLLDNSSQNDPRVQQARRKIAAIEQLIEQERLKFTDAGSGENAFSALLAEFAELRVDVEFAEKSYVSAQATYDAALAEAQRTSRYLATHIEPTLAETAEYPQRIILLLTIGGILFISWAILTMIYYSLRDRR